MLAADPEASKVLNNPKRLLGLLMQWVTMVGSNEDRRKKEAAIVVPKRARAKRMTRAKRREDGGGGGAGSVSLPVSRRSIPARQLVARSDA